MPLKTKNRYKFMLAAFTCIVIAGCADSRPAEEIVYERSQARLDLLLTGDVETAFKEYTSPSYQVLSGLPAYRLRYGGIGHWTAVVVDTVNCPTPEVCDVRTKVSYEYKNKGFKNTKIFDERWINIRGKWYIHHKQ